MGEPTVNCGDTSDDETITTLRRINRLDISPQAKLLALTLVIEGAN